MTVDTPVRRPVAGVEPDVPAWLLIPPRRRPTPPVTGSSEHTPARGGGATMAGWRTAVVDAGTPDVDGYALPPLPEVPARRPEPRLRFRPDVEGLRGIAVLLVVLYHADLPWLRGGFVGVDVFFVLSGYLVTALLVAEVRRDDTVSLAAFYARRCRRILPAAGVVLVATAGLGAVLLPPLARLDLARDILTCALLGGNWHVIAERTDYLRAGAAPSPLLHYWSFGVEELFYIAWPVVFVGSLLLARRFRLARTTVLAAALTVLTAVSFGLSLRWTSPPGPLAYLSSPARGWQFAAGAWLVLLLPVAALLRGRVATGFRALLGLGGGVALGGAALSAGTAALVPTLATAALLAAGGQGPADCLSGVSRMLATPFLRRLGALSFTWYLWHWPLVAFAATRFGELGWALRLGVVIVALGPAALTTRWVERPLRRSRVASSGPRAGLALGVAAMIIPVVAAVLLASSSVATLDPGGLGQDVAAAGRVDRGVVHFDDLRRAGPVAPSVRAAAQDVGPGGDGCLVAEDGVRSPDCVLGTVGELGPVVLLGDSRADQWRSAVRTLADGLGTAVVQLTKAGCPVAELRAVTPSRTGEYLRCYAWRENTFRRLESGPTPRMVVVASYSGYPVTAQEQAGSWQPTLRRLVALGAPVVYVSDTPTPPRDVPGCVSGALDDWSACAFRRSRAVRYDPVAEAIADGRLPGVFLVDLTPMICPDMGAPQTCPAVRGGVLLYRDGSHLTETAVRVLTPQFVAAVRAQIR